MPLFSDIGANPEEEITYRVNVDTSNLSAQLQQVRQEIGQSMQAGGTFSAPTMGAMMAAPIGAIENAQQQISTHANTAFGSAVMGLQRFSEDAQMAVERVGGGWRDMYRSFMATGWSPDMPITRRDWGEAHRREMDYDIRMGFRAGGMVAGTAAGAWFGPWGAAIGGWAGERVGGMAHTAYATTIGRGHIALEDTERFIRDTSWRFAGGRIEGTEARDLAYSIQAMRRDPAVRGERLGRSDIQEIQAEFTEIGGFDFVRSAEEYADRMRQVVTQHRDVMRTLRVSRSEALQIMRGMDDLGLEGQGFDYATTAAMTNAMARRAGYRGTEMLEFGMQSAQLAQGFGLNMGGGFLSGMEVLTMLREHPGLYSRQMIQQAGGIENIAMNVQQRAYQWATGTQGFLHYTAGQGAGDWQPFGERALGAVQNIRDVGDFLTQTAMLPSRISQDTAGTQFMFSMADNVARMNMMAGAGVDVTNPAHYIGLRMRQGLDHQSAVREWREFSLINEPIQFMGADFAREAIWGAETSPWSRIWDRAWSEPAGRAMDVGSAILRGAADQYWHRPLRGLQRRFERAFGIEAPTVAAGGINFSNIADDVIDRVLEAGDYAGTESPMREEDVREPYRPGHGREYRRVLERADLTDERLRRVGFESIQELDEFLLGSTPEDYTRFLEQHNLWNPRTARSRELRRILDERSMYVWSPEGQEDIVRQRLSGLHATLEAFDEIRDPLMEFYAKKEGEQLSTDDLIKRIREEDPEFFQQLVATTNVTDPVGTIRATGGPGPWLETQRRAVTAEGRRLALVESLREMNIDVERLGIIPEEGEPEHEIFRDVGLQVNTGMAHNIQTMLQLMRSTGIAVRQAGGIGVESADYGR